MNCNTAFSKSYKPPVLALSPWRNRRPCLAVAAAAMLALGLGGMALAVGLPTAPVPQAGNSAGSVPGGANRTKLVSLRRAPAIALRGGSAVYETLTFQVRTGFHLNSNHPKSAFLIPTRLDFATAHTGLAIASVRWPPARELKFEFSPEPLPVFSGTFPVRILLRAEPGARSQVLRGTLRYQACNDTLCRPPASLPIALRVTVR